MRERTPFPRSLLERLPNLRLLVTTGMRNKSIDLEAAAESGIVVSGTDLVPTSTVELTWPLILAVVRDTCGEDRRTRAGQWQQFGLDVFDVEPLPEGPSAAVHAAYRAQPAHGLRLPAVTRGRPIGVRSRMCSPGWPERPSGVLNGPAS